MSLMDEFEHLITEEVEETTFEQDSKNYIEKANRFIDDANRFNNITYQGIPIKQVANSLFIGTTDVVPWEHVTMTIDFNKLKTIGNNKLISFVIPDFVEEICGIQDEDISKLEMNHTIGNKVEEIIIPKSVIVIDSFTFAFYKYLKNVTFESDSRLISIGKNAFSCCKNLNKLDIRNCISLDELRDDVITGSGLKSLLIPSSVKNIINIENTDIKKVIIDEYTYTRKEYIEKVKECNGVFWDYTDYSF